MNDLVSSATFSESEPTIIDYARFHNLATDYLSSSIIINYKLSIKSQILSEADESEAHLPQFPSQSTQVSTYERLQCTKENSQFLESIQGDYSPSEYLTPSRLDVRIRKRLKCELPIIAGDHEADVRAWLQNNRDELRPSDVILPMETLDDENGESLQWPSKMWDLPAQVMQEVCEEKKQVVGKEVVEYLQDVMKRDEVKCVSPWTWEGVEMWKRNKALEPVSPPLLPMSTPYVPYIPSSPALHLPLFSSSDSMLSDEAREAEEAIFKDDRITSPLLAMDTENEDMEIDFDILDDLMGDDSSSTFNRAQAKRLKVEQPLTPPLPTAKKAVAFSNMVEINTYMDELRPNTSLSNATSNQDSEPDISDEINALCGPAAAKVEQALAHEQLVAADSTQRVPVPKLDFSLPTPPWEFIHGDTSNVSKQLRVMVDTALDYNTIDTEWAGISKLSNKLRWNPWDSRIARVDMTESLDDDRALDCLLEKWENEKVATSSDLTWKPEGLRVLKEEDIEDDLEAGRFPKPSAEKGDLSSLVRKRRQSLEEKMAAQKNPKSLKIGLQSTKDGRTLGVRGQEMKVQGPQSQPPLGLNSATQQVVGEPSSIALPNPSLTTDALNFLDPFSAAGAVTNFVEQHAKNKSKLKNSEFFAIPAGELTVPVPEKPLAKPEPEPAQLTIPLPNIPAPQIPHPIIVSCALFQDRSLKSFLKDLEKLSPQALLIERDFSRHNTTAWLPNTPTIQRSPIISPLDSEADIIISPSTGILLTTLQKISQKPLPGSKAIPKIHTRITSIAPRYERLLVLIVDPASNSAVLPESSCAALADLTAFTTSLSHISSILPHYIPATGLAQYVVALISRYSVSHLPQPPALLNEETHWELFLRRAGCNAFMAQVIVGALKPPDGVDGNRGSKRGVFGLSAFVEMDSRERAERFAGLCGGVRVLERVGSVLDGGWR